MIKVSHKEETILQSLNQENPNETKQNREYISHLCKYCDILFNKDVF